MRSAGPYSIADWLARTTATVQHRVHWKAGIRRRFRASFLVSVFSAPKHGPRPPNTTCSRRAPRAADAGRSAAGPTRARPLLGRTAVKLLLWETTHLSAFAFSAQPGVSLDVGQLIGLTIADVLIVVYLVVVACTGGRRSVHDYVAATEVCPSMAKRDR